MIFIVDIFLILIALYYLLLCTDLDSLYHRSYTGAEYSDSTNGSLIRYTTHMKNKGGISAFQDGWNYIMLWEEDGELHYPNDPNHWKKAILSREGKNTYVIINLIGCAYIIILLLMFSYEHIASFWFYVGLLPPSIYFYRRFKRDLLIQGYLDGYVDGYADGHRESNEKHNQLNNRY